MYCHFILRKMLPCNFGLTQQKNRLTRSSWKLTPFSSFAVTKRIIDCCTNSVKFSPYFYRLHQRFKLDYLVCVQASLILPHAPPPAPLSQAIPLPMFTG